MTALKLEAPRPAATAFAGGRALDFDLPASLEAHEPPEARGLKRSDVRLLVSRGVNVPVHAQFDDLPAFLEAGDLLVVNVSSTVPAAIDGQVRGEAVTVHVSTELPGGLWLVELRQPHGGSTTRFSADVRGEHVVLAGGAGLDLLAPSPDSSRVWLATFSSGGLA